VLNIKDKNIVDEMFKCGHGSKNKRIPRWVFNLSKGLMETLLDAMMMGDGTNRNIDNSWIYYTSSPGLADDVQELAFLCGFETSKYGPYDYDRENEYNCSMFQIHVNKTRPQFKKCIRSNNIKCEMVNNQKIVCFTVPNRVLITRRNGHIAIQGNSKHAMQLVRLMRQGMEILETGEINVYRPDREELVAIRNGAWSYDKIVNYAQECEDRMDGLYKSSILPKQPDRNYIDQLCVNIIREYIRTKEYEPRKQ